MHATKHRAVARRIGIYAGTFNPVHVGHVAFAMQAQVAARLDAVYFLPERQPRGKSGVEHFAHRVAMLRQALTPYVQFDVLEFVDTQFSVVRTLPQLQQRYPDDELVLLLGSDVMRGMATWPHVAQLLESVELVVGVREQDELAAVHAAVEHLPETPRAITVFESYAPHVSSAKIRTALQSQQTAEGLLKSVERYSNRNWLYVSLKGTSQQKKP